MLWADPLLLRYNPSIAKDGSREFGDLNTGDLWKAAEENMLVTIPDTDAMKEFHHLVPINLFDDSTMADNLGRLNAQPILCTIGMLNGQMRRKVDAWFPLTIIPEILSSILKWGKH